MKLQRGWSDAGGRACHTRVADTYLAVIDATRDESRPPDRRTPRGASDMRRFTTAPTRVSYTQGRKGRTVRLCRRSV